MARILFLFCIILVNKFIVVFFIRVDGYHSDASNDIYIQMRTDVCDSLCETLAFYEYQVLSFLSTFKVNAAKKITLQNVDVKGFITFLSLRRLFCNANCNAEVDQTLSSIGETINAVLNYV